MICFAYQQHITFKKRVSALQHAQKNYSMKTIERGTVIVLSSSNCFTITGGFSSGSCWGCFSFQRRQRALLFLFLIIQLNLVLPTPKTTECNFTPGDKEVGQYKQVQLAYKRTHTKHLKWTSKIVRCSWFERCHQMRLFSAQLGIRREIFFIVQDKYMQM